jgi:uncharacterized membrane protein
VKTTQILDKAPTTLTARTASRTVDLALALLGGLLLLALIILSQTFPLLAPWLAPLRLLLGLAYVLYVPGYLLQALLFPRLDDLDGIERLGLSLGLSVALVPLLALLLDRLPWGLRFWPILIGQSLLVLLLLLAALIRRYTLPTAEAYAPNPSQVIASFISEAISPANRRLYLFATAALLLAAFAAAWVFLVPSPAEFMTEFYALGKDGLAEDYPRRAAVGETLTVTLGVTNRERDPQAYRVEIWQVDPFSDRRSLAGQAESFTLPVGDTRQWSQPWQALWSGDDQQFEFLLFTAGQPEPYRRLLLWLDVERNLTPSP